MPSIQTFASLAFRPELPDTCPPQSLELTEGTAVGGLRPKIPWSSLDSGLTPSIHLLQFSSVEREPPWPISQEWNFNIQHSLGDNTVWEIGYYGTKAPAPREPHRR